LTDFGVGLIEAFVEDTSPLVDDVGSYVLELERSLGEGKRAPELTRRMRARLHTIKGNAGMVGQEVAADLCHILEDACALLDEPSADTRALIQLLLAGVDQLTGLLASRGASADPRQLAPLRHDLRRLAGVAPAHAPSAPEPGAELPIAAPASVRASLRIDLTQLDMLLDGLGEAIFLQSTLEAGPPTQPSCCCATSALRGSGRRSGPCATSWYARGSFRSAACSAAMRGRYATSPGSEASRSSSFIRVENRAWTRPSVSAWRSHCCTFCATRWLTASNVPGSA